MREKVEVQVGTELRLRDLQSGELLTVRIIPYMAPALTLQGFKANHGPKLTEDGVALVTDRAPLGKALVGKRLSSGEIVTIDAPAGRLYYEIVSIEVKKG
jgi:transcription elongation GreA/GreB family factor